MDDLIYFMKFSGVVFVLVVAGLFAFSIVNDSTDNFFDVMGLQIGVANNQDVAKEIYDAVNDYRKSQGLKGLAFDVRLSEVAQQHSNNMADQNILAHTINGLTVEDRIHKSGYKCNLKITSQFYSRGSENILYYSGSLSVDEILKMWIDSPSHRNNMLAKYWHNSGVGIASNNESVFITQTFC